MTAGMTAYERVVLGFFLIHIIYLFFQSRLLLHPVCLRRVIALIPSHSLLTLWLFTQRELFQASPKKSTLQRKSWQSARKGWKTELCGCSGETFFLKESAPCCQIFSFFLFFSCLFFPCCHSGFSERCCAQRGREICRRRGKKNPDNNVLLGTFLGGHLHSRTKIKCVGFFFFFLVRPVKFCCRPGRVNMHSPCAVTRGTPFRSYCWDFRVGPRGLGNRFELFICHLTVEVMLTCK